MHSLGELCLLLAALAALASLAAATPVALQEADEDEVLPLWLNYRDRSRRSPSASSSFYAADEDAMGAKRAGAKGFHEGIFDEGFGGFTTLKKRRPEMTSRGVHGDAFTALAQLQHGDESVLSAFLAAAKRPNGAARYIVHKRKPYIVHKRFENANGFYGDTFSNGFGDFGTAKKRFANGNDGFYGDTFSNGFGDFSTAKKRMVSSFHGDTFSDGFGDFSTV